MCEKRASLNISETVACRCHATHTDTHKYTWMFSLLLAPSCSSRCSLSDLGCIYPFVIFVSSHFCHKTVSNALHTTRAKSNDNRRNSGKATIQVITTEPTTTRASLERFGVGEIVAVVVFVVGLFGIRVSSSAVPFTAVPHKVWLALRKHRRCSHAIKNIANDANV